MSFPHSWIPVTEQDWLSTTISRTSPSSELIGLNYPVSYAIESAGSHTLVSLLWFKWRQPLQNLMSLVVCLCIKVDDIVVCKYIERVDIAGDLLVL